MPHWLDSPTLLDWLNRNSFAPPVQPVVGGFRYSITARDPEAAVQVAAVQVERIEARATFARAPEDMRLNYQGRAYVSGVPESFPLFEQRRRVSLPSLFMGKHLYAVGVGNLHVVERERSSIDDALDQAAALNSRALASALIGAWVALEALLTETQGAKDIVAATRAAAIVACSWPRAELTSLLKEVRRDLPPGRELRSSRNQRGRLLVLTDWLKENDRLPLSPSWRHDADLAATERMRVLLREPKKGLQEVTAYLETSFRRLYRARNIIVHGGSTASVALPATLRVTAPLVAAALDRIAYSYLSKGREPLVAASRAELAIGLLDSEFSKELVDLGD